MGIEHPWHTYMPWTYFPLFSLTPHTSESVTEERGWRYFPSSCSKPKIWVDERKIFFLSLLQTSAGVSDAWIGVSDLTNDGVLSWLDGSPPHFMNWDFYQKNFPGKKCGVIFTNFNWKYKACDGSRGFVCKRPLRGQWNHILPFHPPFSLPSSPSMMGGRGGSIERANKDRTNDVFS